MSAPAAKPAGPAPGPTRAPDPFPAWRPTAPPPFPWARAFGLAAVTLVSAGFFCLLALHAVEPQLSPVTTYISDYGETPHAYLVLAAYVLTGLGGIMLGLALRHHAAGSLAAGAGGVLLALAGAAFVGMVVWPVGEIHVGIVRVEEAMLLAGIGLLIIGVQDRGMPAFSAFSALLVVMSVLGVIRVEQWVPWPGVVQRVYVTTIWAWVVCACIVAMRDVRPTTVSTQGSVRSTTEGDVAQP